MNQPVEEGEKVAGSEITNPAFGYAVMTDVHLRERQLPQSTVQMAGQVAGDVVGGISKTPLMLGVITLNLVGVVAAVYFLNLLINGQQKHLANLLTLQTDHLNTIINTHNREFDALMTMNAKVTEALHAAANSQPTPSTPTPPATTASPPRR
jgi:hypothetical protein